MKKFKCSTIVPKVFYKYQFSRINLDIGAGKYLKASHILAIRGAYNLRLDPYLLPTTHNEQVLKLIKNTKLNSITCNNVLNVISKSEREEIYKQIKELQIKNDCIVYFQIHEGNKNGIEDEKQNNQMTSFYYDEIKKYLNNLRTEDNIIISDPSTPHPI